MWQLYILLCKNGSLYTGITTDLSRRLAEHKSGKGAKYTRAFRAGKIVYSEQHRNRSSASRREAAIKNLTRIQKQQLIKSHGPK